MIPVCWLCLLGWMAVGVDNEVIDPAAAIKSIGKGEVVVEMKVAASKNALDHRGVIYLDSEKDFKSETNLGVALTVTAAKQLAAAGIENPAEHYLGKTIRIRGCVIRLEERPYLVVTDAKQIELRE